MRQLVVAATVTPTDRGLIRLEEELEKLDGSYVMVGFQEGEVTKSQTKGGRSKKAGQNMAQIAADNEFGTSKIPARSFMRTSFDENQKVIDKAIGIEYDQIIEGKKTVRKSLVRLGVLMEGLIKKKIRSIHYPPNSPRTIAAKKSSKPLIDFGQMIAAIHSKVVVK